jgi:hypothetical protein
LIENTTEDKWVKRDLHKSVDFLAELLVTCYKVAAMREFRKIPRLGNQEKVRLNDT